MSADEIKALAQQAFVDGVANHKAGFKSMESRCKQYAAALLAFAAMVERCEEVVKEITDKTKVSRFDEGISSEDYNVRAVMSYVIYGDEDHELRGDAGEGEGSSVGVPRDRE